MVLSIGAAVITGVVVIGVVAGPAAATCLQRGDFWACMNQTMFGSQPEATTAETAAQPVSTETDATPSDESAQQPVSSSRAPTFDLVRVEPDGSAVFAGSATPSGEIVLYLNDDRLGSETVDPSGDWVFVADDPLATGGVELRVFDVQADRYADTAMIVVVQDDRAGEPLVIASAPGEASEILQGLGQSEPVSVAQIRQAESLVVQTDDVPLPAGQPAPGPDEEPTLTEDQSEATAGAVIPTDDGDTALSTAIDDAPTPVTQAELPVAQTETSDVSEPETTEITQEPAAANVAVDDTPDASALADAQLLSAEAVQPDLASPEADIVADAPSAIASPIEPASGQSTYAAAIDADGEPETATGAEALDAGPQTPSAGASASVPEADLQTPSSGDSGERQTGEVEHPSETAPDAQLEEMSSQAVTSVSATIDAIEIDGDLNFFAGSGTEGSVVHLYVENRLVGSAIVSDGRWLVEAIGALTEENQRVRIDMLGTDGAVASRAEVDFVLDLPDTETPIVVAEQSAMQIPDAVPHSSSTMSAEVEISTEATEPVIASSEPEQPAAPEQPEAVEQATSTENPAVIEATEQPAIEALETAGVPPLGNEPGTSSAGEAAAGADLQSTTGQAAPSLTVSSGTDRVPTMVGVTDGSRTTSGLAIIRRGDNLWTIALRVYGEGIRYTQIFEANTDQIRNPDLIYPGQVFDLPGTNTVVGEDDQDCSQPIDRCR